MLLRLVVEHRTTSESSSVERELNLKIGSISIYISTSKSKTMSSKTSWLVTMRSR